MPKLLKTTIIKALIFTVLIAIWNVYNDKSIQSSVIQAIGAGLLYGVFIYFIDKWRMSKMNKTDN